MTESLTNEHKTTELKPDNTWKISNQWLERGGRRRVLRAWKWEYGWGEGRREGQRQGGEEMECLKVFVSILHIQNSILHIQNSLIFFLISFPQILIWILRYLSYCKNAWIWKKHWQAHFSCFDPTRLAVTGPLAIPTRIIIPPLLGCSKSTKVWDATCG